ncbi:MAG: MlaD family protein [Solirubrobacteraceae bacterium]|nr:MlaD family protein [Solirubrobacteraceae bacterium]
MPGVDAATGGHAVNLKAPSRWQIASMIGFALSCVGLLLFLWMAFGGPVPLRAEGYRIKASFPEGAQLASEADVRISGVSVGKVKRVDPSRRTGRTETLIEIEPEFAPLPRDTRAILRAKTLLGETYVELSAGDRTGPGLQDGDRLPDGRVADTVEFDELLRTFDTATRRRMGEWTRSTSKALRDGGGADLSAALGVVSPFADELTTLLRVLDAQQQAVRGLVRDGGRTFAALSERQGELSGLIVDTDRFTEITDRRSDALQRAIVALPPFQRESERLLTRLGRFSRDADPVVRKLLPVASELTPTLRDLERVAPDLRALFVSLDPLIRRARTGLPALAGVTDELRGWIGALEPYLRELNPILGFLGDYDDELRAFFANAASATGASAPGADGERYHYLRQTIPINLEMLGVWPKRLPVNRANAYPKPGFTADPRTMRVLDDRFCDRSPAELGGLLGGLLGRPAYGAPPCERQSPFALPGATTQFPQVHRDPPALPEGTR